MRLFIRLVCFAGLLTVTQMFAATFMVTHTGDAGPGSLRQAMLNANATLPGDTIAFNIPGTPPFRIKPTSPLPGISSSPAILDGTTQPGYAGTPLIEIDGSLAGSSGVDGINVSATGCIIRGLAVNRFSQAGISIYNPSNLVEQCYVGTDVTGTQPRGNGYRGIWVVLAGFNTLRSNLISGNLGHGIDLGTTATNALQGNFIGTDANGTQPLGNWGAGVFLGYTPLGKPLGNRVGGTHANEGNTIAFNKSVGVFITRSAQNPILGNSIFANGGIGIDLSERTGTADGPTRNDIGDSDSGGNLLQNFPSITNVVSGGGTTTVSGVLTSSANALYRLEFFSNPNPSPKFAFSEGRVFLGFANIASDGTGSAPFTVAFPGLVTNVTATATDTNNNTSEFSTLDLPLPPATPQPGDLYVSIDGSRVQWRRADGTPVKELRTGAATSASPQGLALDPAGNLFATTLNARSVVKFDPSGNPVATNTSGILYNTVGVRLDAFGNQLVSLDNGDVMKFNPAGMPVSTVSFGSRVRFDLAPDQQTLFYSPSLESVRRYDIANDLQLPDFTTLSGPQLLDISILADGRVLLVNANLISLHDTKGSPVRTFGQSTVPRNWVTARAVPDGQSFWVAGDGPFLNRFNLNTGELLDRLYIEYQIDPSNLGLGLPLGLAIRGGFNAGNSGLSLTTVDAADPVSAGGLVAYTLTAVNNTPNAVANVVVTNTLAAGVTFSQATTSAGTFTQDGGHVVFSLGTLAPGGTASMTVMATVGASGTITNMARLTGTGLNANSPEHLSVQTTLVVNGPASPTTVFTTNDAGPGSLRSAILTANNRPGPDTISFNIPGAGVHTIRTATALPLITSPVTVDGYSQPGAQPNSLGLGHNGVLLIELDGSLAAGSSVSGLSLVEGGAGSLIRGLVINRFSGAGVTLTANTEGTRIEGNFIGTDAAGLTAAPNKGGGITLNEVRGSFPKAPETIIGGITPDKRNLISGNKNNGMFVYGSLPSLVRIKGNYIGTDKTGLAGLPNIGPGVSESAEDCQVGGIEPGAGNIIAFNTLQGVTLGQRAVSVSIRRNSIHSNGALGIAGAHHPGPQLTSATPGASTVAGFFSGTPSTDYSLDIFANVACDPTGFGEGQNYIGSTSLTTDPSGYSAFTCSVSPLLVSGQFITATATDKDGDTSFFSHCVQVGPANNLSIVQTASVNPLPAGSNITFTATISNAGPAMATGVFMTFEMPGNFTYVSGSSGVQNNRGRVTASVGVLAAGAATNLNVVLRPIQVGPIVNTFIVTGDQPDNVPTNNVSSVAYQIFNPSPRTLLVTTTNTSGAGSLYQAIVDLNTGPGGETIAFNIPGPGVHTILKSFLPGINVPATIDGFTQPGSHPNTLAAGSDALLLIELSGARLDLYGGYSTVRGLVINSAGYGISLGNPASDIPSRNNVIEGCFIGVNPSGTVAKPNSGYGLFVRGSRGDRIGGTTPAARNVISGNFYAGIGLLDEARETSVQGNYIGTDASGTAPLGNGAVGVYSETGDGAGIMIGGSAMGQANVIAYNGGPGVLIYTGSGVTVSANSIFGNGGIGIDLGGYGSVNDAPPANDLGDLDVGANDLLNAPVVTQVIFSPGSTRIAGTLNARPSRLHRLEFFSSPSNPPAFYLSEGKTYLGAVNVTTDGSGNAAFDVTLPASSQYISATATDPDGNTSPFSTFGYQAPTTCFQPGDLLIGFYGGAVQWRRADGRPVRVLRVPADDEARGMAFASNGELFVTGYQGQIYRFDPCGNPLPAYPTGVDSDPASILFDGVGNFYVGFSDPTQNVRKYGATGNLVSQFNVSIESGGADWIDLAADGQALFYTSKGTHLKRFNLATRQQLPDLLTNLLDAAGVRVLPDGGVMVAAQRFLQRFDAAGSLVRNYSVGGVFNWTSVNLDPDGISFWSVGGQPPSVARFNLETGALMTQIPVDATYLANSLAVMGEVTAIGGGGDVRPKLAIDQDGADVLLSWPESATGFLLEHSASIGTQSSWQSDNVVPTVSAGRKTVHQKINSTQRYFRLRKP